MILPPAAAGLAASRRRAVERRIERSVYVFAPNASKPTKVTIKTGISDGVATEIVEGLKEGDRVVTGVTDSSGAASSARNQSVWWRRSAAPLSVRQICQ